MDFFIITHLFSRCAGLILPTSIKSSSLAIEMDASYVPNNPQFGLQLECNWSAPSNQLQQVRENMQIKYFKDNSIFYLKYVSSLCYSSPL